MSAGLTTASSNGPIPLGNWNLPSGNQCAAALVKNIPDEVSVRFHWSSPATPKDREYFNADVVPLAMERAHAQVVEHAEIVQAIRDLVKEGLVEEAGVRDGKIVYRSTEHGRHAVEDSGSDVGVASPSTNTNLELVPTDDLIDELGRRCDAFVFAMVQFRSKTEVHEFARCGGFPLHCLGLVPRLAQHVNEMVNQITQLDPGEQAR